MIEVERSEGPVVKDLDSMIEFAKDGIVSKTFLERQEFKMVLFCMTKGQALSEHTASMPAAIHVLRGKAVIHLDETAHDCKPGSWIYMPKEQKHAVDATEDLVFLLTLFRGPQRSMPSLAGTPRS
jgi:quercetin dioxygenase-like cupin family protein